MTEYQHNIIPLSTTSFDPLQVELAEYCDILLTYI